MTNTIEIIQKGITDIPADCIVNAANEGLREGGGVCGAIFRAAGSRELTAACREHRHCDTGNAVITPAFRLNASYIIHAVGPVYNGGNNGEARLLYGAYKHSLQLMLDNNCKSIVFPVISSGIFGYPKKEAWDVAITACKDFCKANPDQGIRIIFAVPNSGMADLGEKILRK